MKVVILAGGFGTRISEETEYKPKPMVEIGGNPILWHIMKIYSYYGLNDFVILVGYKGYLIKEYFANYILHQSNITINLRSNKLKLLNHSRESWKVTILDTGLNTMTGGRIKRAQKIIGNKTFLLTYGDGLSDINIRSLLNFHKSHEGIISLTAVQPEERFGLLDIDNNINIAKFMEKPKDESIWVNGGFFVCEPEVFDYIKDDDETIFEREPLENLAKDSQLFAYKHKGFWKCMDTLRDKILLEKMWKENRARWRIW